MVSPEFWNSVGIYSPAKTVADCFKFRNRIGLDVALEALREIRRNRLAAIDELFQMAKVCRVANIMRPYLEAMSWSTASPLSSARFCPTWRSASRCHSTGGLRVRGSSEAPITRCPHPPGRLR